MSYSRAFLTTADASFTDVLWQQGIPLLDSDLCNGQMVKSEAQRKLIKAMAPSGWLNMDGIPGSADATGKLVGSLDAANANKLSMLADAKVRIIADGNVINLTRAYMPGCEANTGEKLYFKFDAPPTVGSRLDLAFIEFFYKEVYFPADSTPTSRRLAGLTDSGRFFNNGNLNPFQNNHNDATDTIANDMIDPAVGAETTRRVQFQWRLRTKANVVFAENSDCLDQVYAWPANKRETSDGVNESTMQYAALPEHIDAGLYRAGDGSANSKTALRTFDGFIYAIPVALVFRRNTADYTLVNKHGCAKQGVVGSGLMASNISGRPDGLFADQIHQHDILDLRHEIFLGSNPDWSSILRKSFEHIAYGKFPSMFCRSDGHGSPSSLYNTKTVYTEGVSTIDINGANDRNPTDGERYICSDVSIEQLALRHTTPAANATVVSLSPGSASPNGTVFSAESTYFKVWKAADMSVVAGTWAGMGTESMTFTPSTASDIQSTAIIIQFRIKYPAGKGTKFVPLSKSIGGQYYRDIAPVTTDAEKWRGNIVDKHTHLLGKSTKTVFANAIKGKSGISNMIASSLIKDGSVYKAFGHNANGIAVSTSSDLTSWTQPQQVVGLGAGHTDPQVIKDGSTYKMWVTINGNIVYSTSADAINWAATQVAVANATQGSVIKDGSTYKIWCCDANVIKYSTSSDGISWNALQTVTALNSDPMGYDSAKHTKPFVVKTNNIYRLFFNGVDSDNNGAMLYAASVNGLVFSNPQVMFLDTPELPAANSSEIGFSFVVDSNMLKGIYNNFGMILTARLTGYNIAPDEDDSVMYWYEYTPYQGLGLTLDSVSEPEKLIYHTTAGTANQPIEASYERDYYPVINSLPCNLAHQEAATNCYKVTPIQGVAMSDVAYLRSGLLYVVPAGSGEVVTGRHQNLINLGYNTIPETPAEADRKGMIPAAPTYDDIATISPYLADSSQVVVSGFAAHVKSVGGAKHFMYLKAGLSEKGNTANFAADTFHLINRPLTHPKKQVVNE